jgi:RND family efflux transporter MFP subunit
MKTFFGKVTDHLGRLTKAVINSFNQSMAEASPELKKKVKRFLVGCIILIVVIVSVKFILVKREERNLAAEIAAGPEVKVADAVASPGTHTIALTGETRPYQEATLYAKVSGYLRAVKVDKGDVVKAGQVLAVIESPETDQEYVAAAADAKNKKAIAGRMETLFAKKLVSQQEMDQTRADADIAAARLHSSATLKGYETLRAPFAGTITARFADPGALVQNATNSQTSALPVVTVSTIDRLRVDVFVDQHDAAFVEKDEAIQITDPARPGFKIDGKVARQSGALDPRTKMLLTEIDVSNAKKELVPGSFVQVALKAKAPPYVEAPVESLVVKGNQAMVTVVKSDNTITYKPVELANNDGKMLWIASGLNAGETVALSIGDTIPEGGKIRPIRETSLKPGEKRP